MKALLIHIAFLCLQIADLARGGKLNQVDRKIEETAVRVRRHALKHGNCSPLLTELGEGLQILHEMPIRYEKFFIRPRATFKRAVLQIRLDNAFSGSSPKIYDDRIEFRDSDLAKLTNDTDSWLQVVAEIYKSKGFGPDFWKLRLTVGDTWSKETEIRKWVSVYDFDSLVVSGEGGCEWSFDCFPNDILQDSGVYESLQDMDLRDDRWWMMAAGVFTLLLMLLFVGLCSVYCYRRKQSPTDSQAMVSRSISFRKSRQPKCEDRIYEELPGTSLQKLQNKFNALGLEGFRDSPPPLPAPNKNPPYSLPHQNNLTTVLPPLSVPQVCEVRDQDWFNSLELHPSDRSMPCHGSTLGIRGQPLDCTKLHAGYSTTPSTSKATSDAVQPTGSRENVYSNNPSLQRRKDNETYVDMRKFDRSGTQ